MSRQESGFLPESASPRSLSMTVCRPRSSSQHLSAGLSRGFTLVELLVVVGIIALLISILMPALSRAREQAVRVLCASNLRQWGIGLAGYAAGHKNYFPDNLPPS